MELCPPVLGLDIGTRLVGVAIAHGTPPVAVPVGAFERAAAAAEKKILELIASRDIENIVVGLPCDESGRETSQCENVRNFCRRLQKRAKVNIVFVDEYFTTSEARSRLAKGSKRLSTQKERGAVDAVAASILLERYLEKDT